MKQKQQQQPQTQQQQTVVATVAAAATCQSFTGNWQICEIYSTHSTLNHWPLEIFCNRPNLFESLFFSLTRFIQNRKKKRKIHSTDTCCFYYTYTHTHMQARVRRTRARKRQRMTEIYGKKSHPFKTCTTLI